MLKYDKIDITEGIDVDKTNKSGECMSCHYWYYLNKSFSYGPFTCDGCYNIVQRSTNLKNIAIGHSKLLPIFIEIFIFLSENLILLLIFQECLKTQKVFLI